MDTIRKYLDEMISLSALVKRWCGALDSEILACEKEKKLHAYHLKKAISRPANRKELVLSPSTIPHSSYYYGHSDHLYITDNENIFFQLAEVKLIEQNHDDFLCPQYTAEEISKEENNLHALYGDNIPLNVIRRILDMRPEEFLNLLNKDTTENRLITSRDDLFRTSKSNYIKNFFTYKDLDYNKITVRLASWEKWKSHYTNRNKIMELQDTVEEMKQELAQHNGNSDDENPRARRSLHILLLALLKKCGYWPPDRNTTSHLRCQIDQAGLSLSRNTIANILKEIEEDIEK